MKRVSSRRLAFRRRRAGKTDYYQRIGLLKAQGLRLVIRPTLSNLIAQFVEARIEGDVVVEAASSKELAGSYGWKAPNGNIPAAYLTGLLVGLEAKKRGIEKANLDVGVGKPTASSRLYAALKGVLDAQVEVPHDDGVVPEESRIKGEHIAQYAKLVGADGERYQRLFSQYLAKGLKPEDLPTHFEDVKRAMIEKLSVDVKH